MLLPILLVCLGGCGHLHSTDSRREVIGDTFCKNVKAVVVDATATDPKTGLVVDVHVGVYGSTVDEASVASIAQGVATAIAMALKIGVIP